MATVREKEVIPLPSGLEEAVAGLLQGKRDADGMREAACEMDAAREEIEARHGRMEVAVDLIREARDDS